jgi:hypothetical protein
LRGELVTHQLGDLAVGVDLVQPHQGRALVQGDLSRQAGRVGGVGGDLLDQRGEVVAGVAALEARAVQHVDDRLATLDVAQKPVAQPAPSRRAGDEPGHVGDGDVDWIRAHHPELRRESRERVGSDLGLGRRQMGDQRRLAGVGHAHQGHVGQQLELAAQPALGAGLAQLVVARRPTAHRGQRPVAAAAAAAGGDDELVAVDGEVGQHRLAVIAKHHGALGHRDRLGGAIRAAPTVALAVAPPPGPAMRTVVQIQQARHVVAGAQDHVAAMAPVAAVGAPLGLVGLAKERRAAVAAVAGGDVDPDGVDELDHRHRRIARPSAANARAGAAAQRPQITASAPTAPSGIATTAARTPCKTSSRLHEAASAASRAESHNPDSANNATASTRNAAASASATTATTQRSDGHVERSRPAIIIASSHRCTPVAGAKPGAYAPAATAVSARPAGGRHPRCARWATGAPAPARG